MLAGRLLRVRLAGRQRRPAHPPDVPPVPWPPSPIPAARRYVEADRPQRRGHRAAAHVGQLRAAKLAHERGRLTWACTASTAAWNGCPRPMAARLTEADRPAEQPRHGRHGLLTATGSSLTVANAAGETTDDVVPFDYCVVALPNYWISARPLGNGPESGPSRPRPPRPLRPPGPLPPRHGPVRAARSGGTSSAGSYFMLDAFGGCCAYDESARCPDTTGTAGVLGFLLAGEAAVGPVEPDRRRTGASGCWPRCPRRWPARPRGGRSTDASTGGSGAVNAKPRRVPPAGPRRPPSARRRSTTRTSSSSVTTCSTRR